MMRANSSLGEWARFLDTRSDEEAAAVLTVQVARLDGVYEELCRLVPGLYNSPDPQLREALTGAGGSLSRAVELLETVKAGFDARGRGVA